MDGHTLHLILPAATRQPERVLVVMAFTHRSRYRHTFIVSLTSTGREPDL